MKGFRFKVGGFGLMFSDFILIPRLGERQMGGPHLRKQSIVVAVDVP